MRRILIESFVGQRFWSWLILAEVPRQSFARYVRCQCTCGRIVEIRFHRVRTGEQRQCHSCALEVRRRSQTLVENLLRAEDGAYGIQFPNTGAIVWFDAADLALVQSLRWYLLRTNHSTQYVGARVPERIYMHRLLCGLRSGDPRQVDHIDRDGLNNRRSNLRIATHKENLWNARRRKRRSGDTASQFTGVYFRGGRWQAMISAETRTFHLGMFATAEEAAMRYNVEARRIRGQYACLNQVEMG